MHNLRENSTNINLYQSFMLRLWKESIEGEWRVSLENIFTGERTVFPGLSEFFIYLCAHCGRSSLNRLTEMLDTEAFKEEKP